MTARLKAEVRDDPSGYATMIATALVALYNHHAADPFNGETTAGLIGGLWAVFRIVTLSVRWLLRREARDKADDQGAG